MANIFSVDDLRNYNKVLKKCQIGEPLILTEHGRKRFIIQDIEDYERDREEALLLMKLQKAENVVKDGEGWLSLDELKNAMEAYTPSKAVCIKGNHSELYKDNIDIEKIKAEVSIIAEKYQIKSILLFGSRADGSFHEDSDYDLIIELFDSVRVTLITLSKVKLELEEVLNEKVSIIQGPVRDDDMIEIGKTVELYDAQVEDPDLLKMTVERMSAYNPKIAIPAEEVYKELGVAEAEMIGYEDVAFD